MTAKDIQTAILSHYFQHDHIYACTNFEGCGYAEMDVLTISRAGLVHEFEVKISKADFQADFAKHFKHMNLQHGIKKATLPNRFYYCCPRGMIRPDEVPAYAGLMYFGYVGGEIEFAIIKKAPLLHNERATAQLINRICQTLSTRLALNCSLMTYRRNKRKLKALAQHD